MCQQLNHEKPNNTADFIFKFVVTTLSIILLVFLAEVVYHLAK